MELATYNISFKWISGARNKEADCLSRLVTPTSTSINMLTASSNYGPAFHTRSISRRLLNGKAPHHEFDTLSHVKGLLYKHITDAGKKFLTLVIPKSWKYTVLVEAHDKLGHQGNSCTYYLIKCQYYWKGMNKDIQKYIANSVLC